MKSPETPAQKPDQIEQEIINKLLEANQRLEKAGDSLPALLAEAEKMVAEGVLVKEEHDQVSYFYVPDPQEEYAVYARQVLKVGQASFVTTLYDQSGQSVKVTEKDIASNKPLNIKEWEYIDGKLVAHTQTDSEGVKKVTEYDGSGNRKKS